MNHYEWKIKTGKSWIKTIMTGKQRYPSLGIQPVRQEQKDSQVFEYSLDNWKPKIAKSWNANCTTKKQILGLQPVRL